MPDRPTLNSILGTPIVDDFSTYVVPSVGYSSPFGFLDSTTVVDGQGPGLVSDGATFSKLARMIIVKDGYLFSGSTEGLFFGSNDPIEIDFIDPVPAFGVDWETQGFGKDTIFEVFASDDTTSLGTWLNPLLISPPYRFFSVQHAAGIGKVTMNVLESGFGFVDNVTYVPLPEPSAAELAILGFVAVVLWCGLTAFLFQRR